ncbi:MAG: hypothetical protein IT423_08495, partial [Pirellulaceae bacterium]|nr:hypothetical protein [Pirellulaceae bacterium]
MEIVARLTSPVGTRWLACLLLVMVGCSTHAQRLQQPRQLFYDNQLDAAHARLAKLSEKGGRDATVVELDLAMADLVRGDPASAEKRLREVRDKWDHLEQTSAVESATALLTDDQRRAYSGEDYEKLLVRTFLSLSSLMQDGVDAESYTLQLLDKHEKLQVRAGERWGPVASQAYTPPPIGFYLRGLLREATHSNYDDALRAYELTARFLPDPSFVAPDIQRVTSGVHSQPGHGVVYVLALVGRGPYKVEVAEQATSDALLIADRIVSAVGKYSVPPTLAPVKIPRISCPPKPFDVIAVSVANQGQVAGYTLPLADLDALARSTFEARLPEIMARAVSRRVIKKGAVYLAKDQLEASAPLASLGMDAMGVAWEAAESADTRGWGLLPREIQVLRL